MEKLAEMYVTLLPVVIAGIANMVWCKIRAFDFLKKPIDFGKNLPDGKRIFGDNKTFKGFIGMIIFGILFSVLWGAILGCGDTLCNYNYYYRNHPNTVAYNVLIGALGGFAYALFELPNSFLKRRLGITPGKNDISDKQPGGLQADDKNPMSFKFKPGYSDNSAILTLDASALAL